MLLISSHRPCLEDYSAVTTIHNKARWIQIQSERSEGSVKAAILIVLAEVASLGGSNTIPGRECARQDVSWTMVTLSNQDLVLEEAEMLSSVKDGRVLGEVSLETTKKRLSILSRALETCTSSSRSIEQISPGNFRSVFMPRVVLGNVIVTSLG